MIDVTFRTVPVGMEGVPARADMEPGILYHFHVPPDHMGTVVYLCPCGCGDDISLATADCPQRAALSAHLWHFDPDTATLAPSVSHRARCKSHYTITAGRLTDHGPNR